MKTLKELRHTDFKISSDSLHFSKVKRLKDKKLDFDVYLPSKGVNLQREKVWTLEQKRQLIMSILLKRYIPNICVMSIIDNVQDSISDDILQIIDGKQRLTTIIDFINDEFTIELEGKEYLMSDLPEDYRFEILNYDINCQICYDEYDRRLTDQDKIDWFERINFFGTPQDVEHLNNVKNGNK